MQPPDFSGLNMSVGDALVKSDEARIRLSQNSEAFPEHSSGEAFL